MKIICLNPGVRAAQPGSRDADGDKRSGGIREAEAASGDYDVDEYETDT
jgi:hypothetical protein